MKKEIISYDVCPSCDYYDDDGYVFKELKTFICKGCGHIVYPCEICDIECKGECAIK